MARIITKLRERRQIEADLRQMLSASSELEFRRQAQRVATLGSQVIPAIIGNLERADPQLLTAMGTVATLLDQQEMATALREMVRQPQCTDQSRIGAMHIWERYLGLPLDDELLASLADPAGVAISSLESVLEQAAQNPAILIEYVQGLDRQEPDVVLSVARALQSMAHGPNLAQNVRVVEPLRLMAQDVRGEIAAEALQVLGTIRQPEAASALQALIPISAPALRPLAERLLRKQQFAGVAVSPLLLPDPEWRVLLGTVDGLGQQSVWFILGDRQTGQTRFLNVLLNDRAGAVEAAGRTGLLALMLPPRQPPGYIHDMSLPDGSGAMLMLEAPFDVGRRLVLEALARNRETQIPVAAPLRLLSPWLWGVAGADALPPRTLPGDRADDLSPAKHQVEHLLAHPAFSSWMVRSQAIHQAAEEALQHPGWDLEVWVKRLAAELFSQPVVAHLFHARLVAMSEWLLLAGDEGSSRLALVAAEALVQGEPEGQAFVQALIRRDLRLTLHSMKEMPQPVAGRDGAEIETF
jgi:hypothetical protein